ncbi:hypothetical protein TIFTF001_036530 [Ficus carica]|uniref:Uncharacterized protein n=1 Tax=Ficus carica TaxID=3494 RepID=A0AA88J7S9_FICCA|nr:hypothetical protein TIFTF001_036530 [Ficus carica]
MVDCLVDKILWLLNSKAKLFIGAEAEAKSLKLELKILRATLDDTNEPRLAVRKSQFKEVKELWERVEVVLNTYINNVEQQQLTRAVTYFIYPVKNYSTTNWGQGTVRDIREWYALLKSSRQESRSSSVRLSSGNVPRFFEEEELVGVKSRKEELVSMLVGSKPSKRSVISLVGLSGVGKTTLARIVYQSSEVQHHFDCHAWINVSRSYYLKDLLSCVTKMICQDEDSVEGEMDVKPGPINPLFRFLLEKRYVIVFDGVRHPDIFQFMSDFLPDNNKGSRIIITTSDNAIAASCDIIQTLQPLSEQRALELFWKFASICRDQFESRFDLCSDIKELSLRTVRRCHGLPLVIWAMGDLFTHNLYLGRMEEVMSEWKLQLDKFEDEIGEDLSHIEELLRNFYHNYDDLPSRSRLCLMYIGIFPKDYLIPDVKLVKLWIAEGFVREEAGKTLEQVAEAYLNDLVNRNLVQVSHMNYDGTERFCKVHSFVHRIISARVRRNKICQVLQETDSRLFVNCAVHRLSIYGDAINSLEIDTECPRICSVFLFDVNETMMTISPLINLCEKLKHLELLDFENAPIEDLPYEVGNLSLLKYLSLRNTNIKKLPKSVGRLINLQTLDVRNTLMRELPIHIQKLRKLRHVLASGHNRKVSLDTVHGVQIKEGIGCLENLQTLMTVDAYGSSLGVIAEIEKLRQLRWLSISKLTTDMVNTLCSFIEKMNHLESLSLYLSNDRETFHLDSISSPPSLLRRLILKGRLEKLPDWILGLQNLTILGLSFSRLVVDPLKALQRLPNLNALWLHGAYDGEELHFEGVSFQKLKQLVLTDLHNLRMLKIERGALPTLEELRLETRQNDLSVDLQHLRNLQLLECYDMPDEFVLRLQPEGGSEYWKVKHVPTVIFRYHIRGNQYVSYRLGEPGLIDRVKGLVRTTSNVEVFGRQLSFFYNDDDEVARTSNAEWSGRYSFFTDDIED